MGYHSELGLATHYVPQRALPDILASIDQLDSPTLPRLASLLSSFSSPPPTQSTSTNVYSSKSNPDAPSPLFGSVRKLLDLAFSQSSVRLIIDTLEGAVSAPDSVWDERAKIWAQQQLDVIKTRSPTGMKVALMSYRKAKQLRNLKGQFNDDLLMCTAFLVSQPMLSSGSSRTDKV